MDRPDWAPLDIDLTIPSVSRIYDFYLGGSHNFEVDRRLGRRAIARWPKLPSLVRQNRAFLRRAVNFLLSQGVTQFIDIGSGIPTAGSVHDIALAENPTATVVYVDHDPVTVAHGKAILHDNSHTIMLDADLRTPGDIMENPELVDFVDLSRPVGLIMTAVLHLVGDADDPAALVSALADHVVADSHLVISHPTVIDDPRWTAIWSELTELYLSTPTPLALRSAQELGPLFGPFELVEPGLVDVTRWHPDTPQTSEPVEHTGYVGVGRKN